MGWRRGRRVLEAVAERVGRAARGDRRAGGADGRAARADRDLARGRRRGAGGPSRSTTRCATCARRSTRVNGGFGGAPKFPPSSALLLLWAQAARGGSWAAKAGDMAAATLRAMAAGGIYDQIGGGFARYAVDATWTVPHFEKMLYDNALLARAYLHGWLMTRRRRPSGGCARRRWTSSRASCAAPEGGFLQRAGRRLRGRRGQVLRVDVGGAARGALGRGRRRGGRLARRRPRRATSSTRTIAGPPTPERADGARRRAARRAARADPRRR